MTDLRLIRPARQHLPPLGIGDRVRLNTGGPISTVVDIDMDGGVVVSWRASDRAIHEIAFPAVCFSRVEVE